MDNPNVTLVLSYDNDSEILVSGEYSQETTQSLDQRPAVIIPLLSYQDYFIGRTVGSSTTAHPQSRLPPDVQIRSGLVSKHHFRIYMIPYEEVDGSVSPPLVYCEDLRSMNGTYVNDVFIGNQDAPGVPYLLTHGDIITIKPSWVFEFQQPLAIASHNLDDLQKFEAAVSWLFRKLG
jgi:pSer/pThr/pTyr-binding forkhead associated (FHA) protein